MPAYRPARGLREEDHALGVARDLVEVAHHLRLAPPRRAVVGTAAHMPCVELRAERLDELALLARAPRRRPPRGAPHRARASSAGTSSRGDYGKAPAGTPEVRAPSASVTLPRPQAEHVDRPGARADARAARRAPPRRRSRARARAASASASPSASRAASTEECVQPEPCAAPSGCARPGMLDERARRRRAGRWPRSRCPPVTTTARGPSARDRARQRLAASAVAARARRRRATRASGTFGVTTVARGRMQLDAAPLRRRSQQPRAGLGDHHRVEHDRRARPAARRAPAATASIVAPSPSIPIFTASTPMSSATARDLRDDHLRRHRRARPRPRRCSAR